MRIFLHPVVHAYFYPPPRGLEGLRDSEGLRETKRRPSEGEEGQGWPKGAKVELKKAFPGF